MHVTQHLPVTWRNRPTLDALLARLDLPGRAYTIYLRLTAGAAVFAALRQLPAVLRTRLLRARAVGQTPSALQRHQEELAALHCCGVPAHQLRLTAVDLHLFVTDLTDLRSTEPVDVLAAIAASDRTEATEQLAESRLLTRGDRALTEGDLDALEEATRADIAADSEKLARCAALRRQLRASRHGHAAFTRRRPA